MSLRRVFLRKIMGLFDKKHVVKIDADDLKDAKLSSIDFTDENIRKRAFIDVLGARLAMKLLLSQKMHVSNEYSLYTIRNVLEELDIADIYYKGIKVDVRLVFNKNEIFIPRSHFDYDLPPNLYVVLCLKENLSSAEFVGFFEPKNLDKTNANKEFYFIEPEKLTKPEKLKGFLDGFVVEANPENSSINIENKEELFLSFVDKELSKKDKQMLFKDLANSLELREKLVEFENFEIISQAAAKVEVLQNDGTLSFVGGKEKTEEDEISIEVEAPVETETFEEEILNSPEETTEMELNFEPEEEVETETELEKSSFELNGGVIAGGAIVAAAGLGLASELAKGAASATIESAKVESAMIAGVTEVVSAGLEAGSELIDSIPDFAKQKDTDSDFLDIDELPDFGDDEELFAQNDYQLDSDDAEDTDDTEIIIQDDEPYDFDTDTEISADELPDFNDTEETVIETDDALFGEDLSDFEIEEEIPSTTNEDEPESDFLEANELPDFEEEEEDEFVLADTRDDEISIEPAATEDDSEVEAVSTEEEEPELDIFAEIPEIEELPDFAQNEDENEFVLADTEEENAEAESPISEEEEEEDEFVLADTRDDEISIEPAATEDDSEVEAVSTEEEEPELDIFAEIPELEELPDFAQNEDENEFVLADTEEENAEAESPISEEEEDGAEPSFEMDTEDEIVPAAPKDPSAFEYVDVSSDLPDLGYLMENDLDQIEVPNFEYLTQANPDENIVPETKPEESLEEEFNPFDAELPELEQFEEHPIEAVEKIENIEDEQDFLFDKNMSDFNVEETGEIDEISETEEIEDLKTEEPSLESAKTDENQEEVFSLDDFDFKLLEEESSEAAEPEKTEEPKPSDPDAALTFVEDNNTIDKLRSLEELEKDDDDSTEISVVDINPESDEFISQVDDLLNDTDFLDGNKALLETSLLDVESETTITPVNPSSSKNTDGKIGSEGEADLLNVLFEKEDLDNLSDMSLEEGDMQTIRPISSTPTNQKKKIIIVASVLGVVVTSFVVGGNIANKNNAPSLPNEMTATTMPTDPQTQLPNDMTAGMNQPMGDPTGQIDGQAVQSLPGEDQSADLNRDMGKAVSEAFTSDPVNASISKIAWEVPEDLAYNDGFRKYLQIAGKNLKLNLQNDLLLATEMAYSNKVIVDLKIGKDGALQSENILVSSGSKQIDKIVLQSVKETLSYLKLPASEISSPSVNATLIINF